MRLILVSIVMTLLMSPPTWATQGEVASRLFQRLAGTPLPANDPRRTTMETHIAQGRMIDAAKVATTEESFYNITVRQFAAPMSNRSESAAVGLNDFIAMFIGVTRDNRDARELLTGNFLYVGDSNNAAFRAACPSLACNYTSNQFLSSSHFTAIDKVNLARYLVRVSPQRPEVTDPAGVLTSLAWASAHFSGGTNRRATEYAFREFLCTPIKDLMDISVPDTYVRRDVDRAPGGVSATYGNYCVGCHAQLDALSGAWAFLNYDNQLSVSNQVQQKYSQNSSVYPSGFVTRDDSWVNLFSKNQNSSLGWRGQMTGNGVNALGKMLANSSAFSACMAKRAFKKVCHRDPLPGESTDLEVLRQKFENSNYNLRNLFEEAAILPGCVGS